MQSWEGAHTRGPTSDAREGPSPQYEARLQSSLMRAGRMHLNFTGTFRV
eukprot:COSAG03_NODE_1235_length_4502_cov_2.986373_5_plen_49_part_00